MAGRPPYTFTEQQVEQIKTLGRCGFTKDEMEMVIRVNIPEDLFTVCICNRVKWVKRRAFRLRRACSDSETKELVRKSECQMLGIPYYKPELRNRFVSSVRAASVLMVERFPSIRNGGFKHIFGYTPENLMKEIEKKFKQGMSWDNWGLWHIDHISPRSKARSESVYTEKFKKCWDVNNLQPIWASENLSKGDR